MDFKIGEVAQVGKVVGKVIEVIELDKTKKVKVELADGRIAVVSYIKRDTQALGEMRLG